MFGKIEAFLWKMLKAVFQDKTVTCQSTPPAFQLSTQTLLVQTTVL
jgi:hypothetical protein